MISRQLLLGLYEFKRSQGDEDNMEVNQPDEEVQDPIPEVKCDEAGNQKFELNIKYQKPGKDSPKNANSSKEPAPKDRPKPESVTRKQDDAANGNQNDKQFLTNEKLTQRNSL